MLNGEPVFFTGDLGFIDARGSVYITGRVGYSVKVNGFRVNLKDVESHAQSHPLVHEAVAIKEADEGQLVLVIETINYAIDSLKANQLKMHLRSFVHSIYASSSHSLC